MKNSFKFYMPGILMIAISMLIIAVPEILAILVASLLGVFGVAALSLGHMLRNQKVKNIRVENWDSDTDFFTIRFERIPVHPYYRRW